MSKMESAPLSLICEVNPRFSKEQRPAADAEVTFIPMAAIDETLAEITTPQIRRYSEVSKGFTAFREADVLFAKITPCMENGKAAIARNLRNGMGFGSTEFHVLRTGPTVLPEWIYFYIRQPDFRRRAKASFRGASGQQRVPADFLENEGIPLAPISEQRRIVDILSHANGIVQLQRQAADRAREIIPALFLDMFGDPATNLMGWPMVEVGQFVSRFQGGKNFRAAGSEEEAGRFRILKVSAVTYGAFKPEESKLVPRDYLPPSDHLVRAGDLLFSRANTVELVGATAYVSSTPNDIVLPDKLWRFIWNKAFKTEPLFVWALFQTRAIRRDLGRLATGTSGSMKNISQAKLLRLRVPMPPYAAQRLFADRLEACLVIQAGSMVATQHSEALFQSLLHRAFSGML